jgi:hypothetical protein
MKFTQNLNIQNKTTKAKKELKLNNNLSSNKNINLHQNIISNFQLLYVDSRILPLFRTHIVRAKNEELKIKDNKLGSKINSYTQKSLIINKTTNPNNINKLNTNQILKIFLKGIIKYNLNIKSYMLQTNKLNLLIFINRDKKYILNTNISNFIQKVNKLISRVKDNKILLKNLTNKMNKINNKSKKINNYIKIIHKKNDTLFNIYNFLKKQYKFKFNNFPKYLNMFNIKIVRSINFKIKNTKLQIFHKTTAGQLQMEHQKTQELIKFGKEIIKDLNYQILRTKNLNYSLKTNNKVLNYILPFYLDSHNYNYATKNSNFNSYNNIDFDSENFIKKNNNFNLVDTLTNTPMGIFYTNLNNNLNLVNKWNLIQIEQTIKSIIQNPKFDYKTDSISIKSNPISVVYYKNKNFVTESNSSYLNTPILNKYLQVMSKYNMTNKNIYNYYSNIIGFKFINDNNKLFKNIYKLLAYSFKSMYCLISKPVFVVTPNKIIIQLFYYLFIPNILKAKKFYKLVKKNRNKKLRFYLIWKKRKRNRKRLYRKIRKFQLSTRIKLRKLYLYNITKNFPNKFKKLCEILSNLFKKSVEFNLIRLHYPYKDSNILANLLAIFINRIKLRIIAKRLFGKAVIKFKTNNKLNSNNVNKLNIIPAFLSGINIKVAGRLLNNKKVPRKTVKIVRRGAVSKGKINYLDVARYTNKNKRGAYSITVSSGQKFF